MTKMKKERLERIEVNRQFNELFILSHVGYTPRSNLKHTSN